MSFDPVALRADFPLLAAQPGLHYLDNAATAQICRPALEAWMTFETTQRANVARGNHRLAEAATTAYERARAQAAAYLGGLAGEIVFTAGATAALNLVAGAYAQRLQPGDEVLISAAEHHSNFVPWQRLVARQGLVLRVLPVTPEGRLDLAALPRVLSPRCRLMALTHASNVSGAVSDVPALVAAARSVGARVLLDGAQRAPHGPLDVSALGVDFYVLAGHKCFGPTGVGVLWGRAEALAELPPFMSGGGMVSTVSAEDVIFHSPPRRFEAGTPPIAAAIGLGAALTWLRSLPWSDIAVHEARLTAQLLAGLRAIDGLRLVGPESLDARLPVVSFTQAGVHPHDLCQILDETEVALRGGHHCARPLLTALGVESVSRASMALYNTAADVEALLAGLVRARALLQ